MDPHQQLIKGQVAIQTELRSLHPARTWSARTRPSASASSGKYRVRGLPDFDCRSIFFLSRNAKQRNPSHLGSYCQSGPTGRVVAGVASIGGYVLEWATSLVLRCYAFLFRGALKLVLTSFDGNLTDSCCVKSLLPTLIRRRDSKSQKLHVNPANGSPLSAIRKSATNQCEYLLMI